MNEIKRYLLTFKCVVKTVLHAGKHANVFFIPPLLFFKLFSFILIKTRPAGSFLAQNFSIHW